MMGAEMRDKKNLQRADEIAQNGIRLIESGKVRDHKLGNSARVHTGEVERAEYQTYRDFLPSKNCRIVCELTGSGYYESY